MPEYTRECLLKQKAINGSNSCAIVRQEMMAGVDTECNIELTDNVIFKKSPSVDNQ